MRLSRTLVLFALVVTALLAWGTAGAQEEADVTAAPKVYILEAEGTWGAAQDAAVELANGVVKFRHAASGIAIVESEDPRFAREVRRSGAVAHASLDEVVQWQDPVQSVEFDLGDEAVTPGDETFINSQWNLTAIEATGAWNAGYTGAGVRVAILDGGLYNIHADLDANIDVAHSTSFIPGFNYNQDTGTFWHGTHVAGIVAAEDNGIGTVGVAPGATIIGVKVLHNGSGPFSSVIAGILYASTPISDGGAGADIINMSLGALFALGGGNTGAGPLVGAVNRAVNYATDQNVLVVCSAGNSAVDMDHSGSLIHMPSMAGTALAVSATGPMGYGVGWPNGAQDFRRVASYTNYGNSQIWLAAPGGDFALPGTATCSIPRCCGGTPVTFQCWVHDMVPSTVRGSGASITTYSWSAGTSMAAPAVSGVAALVKERFPGISVGDLKAHLAQTSDDEGDGGHDPFYGHGFINARRAATEGGLSPIRDFGPAAQLRPASGTLSLAARPNPAAGSTQFVFDLPSEGGVSLVVHDLAGRVVREVFRGQLPAGEHHEIWNLRDDSNRQVRPGLYFATIRSAAGSVTKSVVAME